MEATQAAVHPCEPDIPPQAAVLPAKDVAWSRMTRLLSARVYLYGVLASVPAIFHITRPLFHARDPGVGYDKRAVLFHAVQSLALSMAFAIPALFLLWGYQPPVPGEYGWVGAFAVLAVIIKVGLINPLISRVYFSEKNKRAGRFRFPAFSSVVEKMVEWMLPADETEGANACYFAGDRPFTGYGTEINAWTLVVDTSAPAQSINGLTGTAPASVTPIDSASLYRAIVGCTAALKVEALDIGWQTFLEGTSANEQRNRVSSRFSRPPHRLSSHAIDELDREGESGRRYMLLAMEKASQGLMATQFVRFHSNGSLMFCEFASYVLAPGLSRLFRLDRLFKMHMIVYFLFGLGLALVAALGGIAVAFLLGYMVPGLGLLDLPEFIPDDKGMLMLMLMLGFAAKPGAALLSISLSAVLLAAIFWGWRLARGVFSVIGLAARLSNEFGVAYSYRERFTSRGNLDYFSLQDVAKFMKIQEKILIKAICDQLRIHGIDSSDFKESLTAYINQGVINSGDIRGNVLTSVKSFVFRRPARAASHRGKKKVANG